VGYIDYKLLALAKLEARIYSILYWSKQGSHSQKFVGSKADPSSQQSEWPMAALNDPFVFVMIDVNIQSLVFAMEVENWDRMMRMG
jgi:hypothetical protein